MMSLRDWWNGLTAARKAVGAAIASLTALSSTYVVAAGWLTIPATVNAHETAIQVHAERIDTLRAQAPKTEYLFCVDLADRDLITKTPQDCYQDYSLRGGR